MNEALPALALIAAFIAGVIWGWAIRRKKAQPAKPLIAKIKMGKGGKWRFVIEDENGKILAVSAVTGYPTSCAVADAVQVLANRSIESLSVDQEKEK